MSIDIKNEFLNTFKLRKMTKEDIPFVKENFSCKRAKPLEDFIKKMNDNDFINKTNIIYLVLDDNEELVAYFSIKTNAIAFIKNRKILLIKYKVYYQIPAIELSNFALNENYIEKHNRIKGIGRMIYIYMIEPLIIDISNLVTVNVIMLFSVTSPDNKVLKNYKKMGFEEATNITTFKYIKDNYDTGLPLMIKYINDNYIKEDETVENFTSKTIIKEGSSLIFNAFVNVFRNFITELIYLFKKN